METLKEVIDLLTTQGGWGVAVIVGVYLIKKDKEHALERQQWIANATELTEVLASLREVIRTCHARGRKNE